MGRRGPLPKPTKLRELEGNPRRRPLPTDEPKPAVDPSLPPAPAFMSPMAQEVWRVIGVALVESEQITVLDYHALEQYCVAYAAWRTLLREIEIVGYVAEYTNDDGSPKYSSPTVQTSLCLKYSTEVNRWSKVLGLGPAYRVGLTTNAAGQAEEVRDPFAARIANG